MNSSIENKIQISKISTSKIESIDFEHLPFGEVFTDYMLTCDFINDKWGTPTIVPYAPFLMDPSSKVFHYGQAIFE